MFENKGLNDHIKVMVQKKKYSRAKLIYVPSAAEDDGKFKAMHKMW